IDVDVGRFDVDGGAAAKAVAELVDDGVFDFEGAVLGVVDARIHGMACDGKCGVDVHVLIPGDGLDAVVEGFGRGCVKAVQGQKYGVCKARPQAGAVAELERAAEKYAGDGLTYVFAAQSFEFFGQELFHMARDGGEKGVEGAHKFLKSIKKSRF